MFRRKKIVLISEIGRANFYYLSPARIVKCVSEYTFSISKNIKQTNKKQESKKAKETFLASYKNYKHICIKAIYLGFRLLEKNPGIQTSESYMGGLFRQILCTYQMDHPLKISACHQVYSLSYSAVNVRSKCLHIHQY